MSAELELSAAWEASLGDTAKRVLEFLGSGLSAASAALASGCTPEYVAQLMAGAEFAKAVAVKRGAAMSKYAKMDALADDLQMQALDQLGRVLKYETKSITLLRAIDTLDRMKRRSTPAVGTDDAGGVQRVRITLPATTAQEYTVAVDLNNKVIQIGANTLLPATSGALSSMMKGLEHDSEPNSGGAAGILSAEEGGI